MANLTLSLDDGLLQKAREAALRDNTSVNALVREYLSRLDHRFDEIHPGEILLEEFLKPMNMSINELTEALDLPLSLIKAIINGTLPITMDVALRLGKFYSMDPKFWLHLQTEYDSRKAKRGLI